MTWYEENRRTPQLSRGMQIVDSLMRDSFESQFELLVPLWNSAFVSSDEKRGLVAVEVPLWGKVQIQHVLEENSLAYDETGNVNYLMSYSRLVILTETEANRTIGFFMTIVPSRKFKETQGFDTFRSKYFEREEDFDGVILFHNFDGSFANGWRYQDGKIIRRLSASRPPQTRSGTITIIETCEHRYKTVCRDEYQVNEYGEMEYVGKVCEEIYVGSYCWYEYIIDAVGEPGEYDPECTHAKCLTCGGCLTPAYKNCYPCTCFTLTISSSQSEVVLTDSYTLEVTAEAKAVGYDFALHDCIIEMKSMEGEWVAVSSSGMEYVRRACGPRTWPIRARVEAPDGKTVYSQEIHVKEIFPSYKEILADADLKKQLDDIWVQTKQYADSTRRCEFGCWIYLDTQTGEFFCGKVDRGPDVEYKMGTNASLTPWPAETGIVKKATKPHEFAVEPVAFFHTHTPLTFSPDMTLRRTPVGPSQKDENWANEKKMLGLVYDYNPMDRGGIMAGHDLNASAVIIPFGPERREIDY